jgi:hypothetical protein
VKTGDFWFPSSIIVKTVDKSQKQLAHEVITVTELKINTEINDYHFSLEGLKLPEKTVIEKKAAQGKIEYLQVKDGKLVEFDMGTNTSSANNTPASTAPTPQPVAGENPNRLYYLIAAGVLLLGAIGIAFVLLRRKANTT